MTRYRSLFIVCAVACSLPPHAEAQAPRQPPAGITGLRWEIEVYGGVAAPQMASEGSRTLPAAGAPIVTSSPIFPSRQTSSWFFGDGATLLNGVNAEFGAPGRITPLDPLLAPLPAPRAGSVGVRLRRRLTERWSAEISVDAMTAVDIQPAGLAAAVESARSSFRTAFADLLGTGPFSGVAIDATAASAAGRRRETALTIALNRRLGEWRSFVPYTTLGGGAIAGSGSLPSATLQGHYHFSVLGEVPIDETDRVSLRYVRGMAFTGVLGGGVLREVSDRWGLRFDARLLFGPDRTRVLLDANPSTARGAPAGFVESFTNPAIQFSNDPSTGRRSSLSGEPLQGFEAFSGGVRTRLLVTVGVTRRF